MPIETHAPVSATPRFLNATSDMYKPDPSDDISVWFADGRGSLGATSEAAFLQIGLMEAAQRLFVEPAAVITMPNRLRGSLFPVLIDLGSIHLSALQKLHAVDHGRDSLSSRLQASFEDNPLEDGMKHPAERIIAEALQTAKDRWILDWLSDFCTDDARSSFAASVLRCLGRHSNVGTTSWRVGLIRDSLAIDNVEIRDAAVQAVESWCDRDSLDVLRSHREPEPWLRQYIFDVMDDLAR